MNEREAYMLAGGPEPTPEQTVDLTCPCCAGFWMSCSKGQHNLGDNEETVYVNFVGRDNVELTDKGFVYYCPNGCTRMYGKGRAILNDVHEVGVMTPHMMWEYANAIVKRNKLRTELDEVEHAIKQFECCY